MSLYTKIQNVYNQINDAITRINSKSRGELFATMKKLKLKTSISDTNRQMASKIIDLVKQAGKTTIDNFTRAERQQSPSYTPKISDEDLLAAYEELGLIPPRQPQVEAFDEIEFIQGPRGQITVINPDEHSPSIIQRFLRSRDIAGPQTIGMFSIADSGVQTPMKVNMRSVNVDNMPSLSKAINVGRYALLSGSRYEQSYGISFGGRTGGRVMYPPVFKGDVNCAIKVYRRYIPKGKNGIAIEKYFKTLNVEDGFTEDIARAINIKYGYGCTMFDQLDNLIFNIDSRNKMKHIVLQAFDQHVYERKDSIAAKYNPTHVIIPSNVKSWYELATELCEQGPQFIYRTDVNTMQQQCVGLRTANAEYKRTNRPLREFDDIDKIYNSLRQRYPHNFATRNQKELEYLQLADHHVTTIWYDRPQSGYEIDFNQAYRAAAELVLAPEYAEKYQFPHYPVWWKKVDQATNCQQMALSQIIKYSGFAHLEDVNFGAIAEPLREYITKQCEGRKVFCSPEIAYFGDIGVTFVIHSIAYNQMNQRIDWQFSESAEISATANKNINRIVMGRIIAKFNKSAGTLACHKDLTPYYQGALGDSVINTCSNDPNMDLIRYWRDSEEVHNQQYHIHAYILCYLRMAMWSLLENIDPKNVIKINIDAVHIKTPIEIQTFEIDNSPLGRLGCVKMAPKTTKGSVFEAEPQIQIVPDVHLPDPIEESPQFLLLGGIAGAGKTTEMIAQPALTCIAAFSNKLANSLRDRTENVNVQTMHTKYGVEFADPELTVTKLPTDHLHNLDDVLLAPARLIENIVRKLVANGKRITITYGPGQATMSKPLAEDLVGKILPSLGFKEKMLMNSQRMEPILAEIAEKYRTDDRIKKIIELDREISKISAKIAKAIAAAAVDPDIEDDIKSLKGQRWRLYIAPKKKIIAELIKEYSTHFKVINTKDAIQRYILDPTKYILVTATNKRREEINNIITESNLFTVKKFRYVTLVNRVINGQRYRRFRSEIVTVTPSELAADEQLNIDIKRGYCEEMHIYTVHSCQGETVEHDILIDLDTLFDPDIFYSAITRPRKIENIVLFSDQSAREAIKIEDPDILALLDECELPKPKEPRKAIDLVVDENTPRWPPHHFEKLDDVICPENGLIIHTEYPHRHFLVFFSREHFAAWSEDQPKEQRCYHEVVQTDLRKVVIDIDGGDIGEFVQRRSRFGCNYPLAESRLNNYVKIFCDVFAATFHEEITIDNIAIINSTGYSHQKQEMKFSLQIRTIDHIATRASCKKFAKAFKEVSAAEGNYVDLGIYKKIQNFRIPGSTKLDDNRHSRIISDHCGSADTWVANITGDNIITLPNIAPEVQHESQLKPTKVDNATEQKIVAAAAEYTKGLRYVGNMRWKREQPSFCDMCERQHESDNMFAAAADGMYRLFCYGGEDGVRPDRAIDLFPVPNMTKEPLCFSDDI